MHDATDAAGPVRVAVIGSGPSGFYAAERLLTQDGVAVEVDMYDRLPTPFGLVRLGVAPDHQKIKTVTKAFDKTARRPGFCFFGNIEFGRDIDHADIRRHYHAVIYAVGARSDRRMGIPGEDLPGSYPATELVGWYNAHPDFSDLALAFDGERAAIVGNGNVALDIARILAVGAGGLAETDISDAALAALEASRIREIWVLGRRGPLQAAFTVKELKELGALEDVDVVVRPEELAHDPDTAVDHGGDPEHAARVMEVLREYASRERRLASRTIHLRFLVSPLEILGRHRVEALRVVRNRLVRAADGALRAQPTGVEETLPVDIVCRAIGYLGSPLPGVPFETRRGIIPNENGRIVGARDGETIAGEYVVGWIKRGPTGIIGTNKPDSFETVDVLLADLAAGRLPPPAQPHRTDVEALLAQRGLAWVTYGDWELIDEIERERGAAVRRPRRKFARIEAMLAALAERKAARRQP